MPFINGEYQFGNDTTTTPPNYSTGGTKNYFTGLQNGVFDWVAFVNAPAAQIMGGYTNNGTNFYDLNDEFTAEFPSQYTVYDQFLSFGWYAGGYADDVIPTIITNNPLGYPTLVICDVYAFTAAITGMPPSPWNVLFYPDPVGGSHEVIMYQVVFKPGPVALTSWPTWNESNADGGVTLLTFNSNIPYGITLFSESSASIIEDISSPPVSGGLLPSFALIGTYSEEGDTDLTPAAVAALVTQNSGSVYTPFMIAAGSATPSTINNENITGDIVASSNTSCELNLTGTSGLFGDGEVQISWGDFQVSSLPTDAIISAVQFNLQFNYTDVGGVGNSTSMYIPGLVDADGLIAPGTYTGTDFKSGTSYSDLVSLLSGTYVILELANSGGVTTPFDVTAYVQNLNISVTYTSVSSPPMSNPAVIPNTPVYVVWNITNIVQVRITGDNGVNPPVDSGYINTTNQGSGSFEIASGFTQNITLRFDAYDTIGHIAVTQYLSASYA